MAEVSIIEPSQVNEFQFKRPVPAARMKRKTPSELREEQLKRRAHEKLAEKGTQPFKVPCLVNTRVTQAYPVVKPVERSRLYWKDGVKQDTPVMLGAHNGSSSSNSESVEQISGERDKADQAFKKKDRCVESALLNVVQLHLRDDVPASTADIDMEKALKGFRVPCDPMVPNFPSNSFGSMHVDPISSDICPSRISIPGKKIPLDLTLKTSLRLISSSSVKWCHRVDATYFAASQSCGCHVRASQTKEELFSKALSSWIYPQSTLPTAIISAMASSKAKGDTDFLENRRLDWENSFRSLYYMLRKKLCSIFYVYTSEFVALFVGGPVSGEKRSCNAYISKSTNSLRSALRKHNVSFTMPLYHNEEVQASADDLAELSEIEKRNLGQAVYTDYFLDVDGTPQSLLSFTGNTSVHSLYDFLLNHRLLFTSLNGGDVPLIYSPVPFQNSSLNFPKVHCKEVRKADMVALSESNENRTITEDLSNSKICYSIEISNSIIPPWVISGVCAALNIDGLSFDIIFTIDHSSMGLNTALNSTTPKLDSGATFSSVTQDATFGISETVLVPSLRTSAVQKLRYTNGEYAAYTTS
ncbi:Protein downstream neighbor of Son [Rhynchospora pubera]|uniref:Protein downstream neighbor of Son n=1 Tax=Rhynchospora pubera TaxID=906938 RepID=A0AAV8F4A0_9POAL|nr:Protein downstream neighbor of Son [Rhynchospora pubera]